MGSTWVLDVDGTLVDSLTGTSLRPGVPEFLATLRSRRCRVVAWSAGGADYARERARQHTIESFFDAFEAKDRRDDLGRYRADFAGGADVVYVDDRPEDLPHGARVLAVSPYIAANPHDRALEPLRDHLNRAEEGSCDPYPT